MDRLAVVTIDAPHRAHPEPLLGALAQLSSAATGRLVTATAALTAAEAAELARVERGIGVHYRVHRPRRPAAWVLRGRSVLRPPGSTGPGRHVIVPARRCPQHDRAAT